jgi:hypothetical protein
MLLHFSLSVVYDARTSRCYSCGGRNQPRVTKLSDDTFAYAPVDCLTRCSTSDTVGPYTVVLTSSVRRSPAQTIGTAWLA